MSRSSCREARKRFPRSLWSRDSSQNELKKLSVAPHRLLIYVWSASTWMSPARKPKPLPVAQRRAVLDRDAAIARVRRATTATLAVAGALVAAFAGLAAASTHSRKAVKQTTRKEATATKTVKTPSVSPPPLQSTGSTAPSPAPPAQTATPSPSPPAAVSGGS